MKKLWMVIALAAFVGMVGCGDDNEIGGQTLSGELAGQSWTFRGGFAKLGSQDTIRIQLADYEEDDPCGIFAFDEIPYIWWRAPNEPTDQELSLSERVIFQVPDGDGDISNNVTDGRYVIDQVGPDVVSGGLIASGFGDSVDGQWEVPLCE